MKVSVIINCYNSEKFLRQTIESVLNQTYKNYELIIYDDASTDNTQNIALSYGNNLKYYRTEIRYPLGKARNEALKYATGELITYLDHDDLLTKDSLEKRVEVFKKNNDIALVFGCANVIDENNNVIDIMPNKNLWDKTKTFRDIVNYYQIPWLTVMIRKSVVDDIGYFEETYMQLEDFDYILKIILKYNFYFLQEIIGNYRTHLNNLTKLNNRLDVLKEFEKTYLNLSFCDYGTIENKYFLLKKFFNVKRKILYSKLILE